MSKQIFSLKTLLASLAVVCVGAGVGTMTNVTAQATDIPDPEYTKAEKVETQNGGSMLMLHLSVSDYMTAAWDNSCNAAYHWYLKDAADTPPENTFGLAEEDIAKYDSLGGQLAYEDCGKYNMPNAPLNKNLDAYNFSEYILIDGVPLSEYEYVMYANRWTHVNTLSIESVDGSAIFAGVTELTIKAGCQMPSLYHSYFGKEEFTTFVVEEEQKFRSRNGAWVRVFDFEGYEMDQTYDASEKMFYVRPDGTSLKGHTEAATYGFTSIFDEMGWGDTGFAVQTTTETLKGNICVFDLVNPIDASQFGMLDLYFFANVPRVFVSHNAYDVTEDSLGKAVEQFTIAAHVFTKVTLLSELYANEDGMIDQLVFEFVNDGDPKPNENQFFLGSFTVRENKINTLVYDESLFISETDNQYQFTLRFNKKGEVNGAETVDASKVLINGISVEEINANGQYATASWAEIAGIYQLDITLDKSYAGEAQVKNADLSYTGNKVAVAEGLVFPDGEVLDRTYTCNLYAGDTFTDREFLKEYEKTSVMSVSWKFFEEEANNINFQIIFDKKLCSQPYLHACDSEGWRESALNDAGWYNAAMSAVFISGGYKSSLLDSILINGKSLGELHAADPLPTVVFAHYGQVGAEDRISLSVDSNSATYQWLKPLFEEGNGVTLEIKSGFKFPNSVMTTEDVKYVLVNGVLQKVSTSDAFTVFFDGKAVADGDVLKTQTAALESSIYVLGDVAYTVTKTVEGNVTTFVVEANGKTVTFGVDSTVTKLDPIDKQVEQKDGILGCGSVISGGVLGGIALALCATTLIRRKRDEEN